MQAPTVAEALEAWERGMAQNGVERSLSLFALARPDASLETLADLSVGARDAALLALREAMFGPEITGRLACAACGDPQEANLDLRDLLLPAAPAQCVLPLSRDGYDLNLRVVSSRDLLAASRIAERGARTRLLLGRVVLDAAHDGAPVAVEALPDSVIDAAVQTLAQADPQADLSLSVTCAACGHGSRVAFDIASYLWEEIDAWAARLLREIHTLASYYGWSERDILALSPMRRRRYLEFATA
jgi:hypothetical protein